MSGKLIKDEILHSGRVSVKTKVNSRELRFPSFGGVAKNQRIFDGVVKDLQF
ncbi:hypothetical protein [Chryseobacterium sp. SL1]|uniref:hypothetical protein n=1 Tax=Chryseobacterium sp. SL1 TaxID=2995159 RepID=UPI00227B4762|nr:hypothetical protein [Chryseobacterium sp. SL1]